jgi:hypothetical protein
MSMRLWLLALWFGAGAIAYGQRPVLLVSPPGNLLKARAPLPKAPFRLVKEDLEGRSPKVLVSDARGAVWQVKFGDEVKAEVFATKLVSALGYYSDVTHYVESGRILGASQLKRAGKHIGVTGEFQDASFEYRDPSLQFLDRAWRWKNNPFVGSRPFNGLKVVVMLLSNWDNKDASASRPNTGILERRRSGGRDWIYYVTDWGGSMGRWGRKFFHNKWDCDGFAEQSSGFIRNVERDAEVEFGFSTGNHGGDFKDGIEVGDIQWLVRRLEQITDSQLQTALRQSGATDHEARHFTSALRLRISQMETSCNATNGGMRRWAVNNGSSNFVRGYAGAAIMSMPAASFAAQPQILCPH